MLNQRIILSLLVVFSIMVFVGRGLCQTSETRQPEYKTDFEQDRQNITGDNFNMDRQRSTQRREMQQRFRPDFSRLRNLEPAERIREMQKMAREQEEQAMKQALGVNEKQWKIIEPKIEKVKACRDRASVSIGSPFGSNFVSSSSPQGGGFSGGFQYQFGGSGNISSGGSSFQNQFNQQQTQGQEICQELQVLLDNPNSSPEAIKQKMLELQRARANAKKQLAEAQKELRKVLTFRQQARLCLMGLLD